MKISLPAWSHAALEVSLFIYVSLTDQVHFAEKKISFSFIRLLVSTGPIAVSMECVGMLIV